MVLFDQLVLSACWSVFDFFTSFVIFGMLSLELRFCTGTILVLFINPHRFLTLEFLRFAEIGHIVGGKKRQNREGNVQPFNRRP